MTGALSTEPPDGPEFGSFANCIRSVLSVRLVRSWGMVSRMGSGAFHRNECFKYTLLNDLVRLIQQFAEPNNFSCPTDQ